jgi:CubicO group peptidase (beta-lactamase class C family)
MSMLRAALVLVMVTGSGVLGQPAAAPERPVVAAAKPDFAGADAVARKWVEELKLPGAGVLVLRGGEVLHEAYFGEYKADTVVPIASSSKWLSGAVIMALVDEKVLDLDKPIGEYLPELPEDKRKLTIRRLFSHTSGMPSDVASAENWLITMEEAGKRLGAAKLEAEPGAEFRYGQAGMQLAAVVACRVTGKSWGELFEAKVAGPCGMKSTKFGRFGLAKNPLVAGGASSTMRDYGNFLTMVAGKGVYQGKRVLSEQAVAEMLKDQTGKAKMVSASLSRMLHSEGYGIGNWVDRKGKDGKPVANSSPGAFGFVPWVDAERGIAGVWMICDRDRVRKDIVKASRLGDVRGEVEKAVDAAKGAAGKPAG